MPFNVDVILTGVVTLVPDKDDTANAQHLLGVMPEASTGAPTYALGDHTFANLPDPLPEKLTLRRHYAFIKLPYSALQGASKLPNAVGYYGFSPTVIIPIKRMLVTFKIDSAAEAKNPFKINRSIDYGKAKFHPEVPSKEAEEASTTWIPVLGEMVKGFGQLDESIAGVHPNSNPVSAGVVAQTLASFGEVQASKVLGGRWMITNLQGKQPDGRPVEQALAREALIHLKEVTDFNLRITPFGIAASTDVIPLKVPDGETLTIHIVNLCDDNPLQWPRSPEEQDDWDFMWHYHLVKNRTGLLNAWRKSPKQYPPIPAPVRFTLFGVNTQNCIPDWGSSLNLNDLVQFQGTLP